MNKWFSFLMLLALAGYSCREKAALPEDPVEASKKFAPPETTPVPQGTPLQLGLAGSAKVFCSALFVSGRKPEEAIVHSLSMFLPAEAHPHVKPEVDWQKKTTTLVYGDTLRRSATYHGDCGCISIPIKVCGLNRPLSRQPYPMLLHKPGPWATVLINLLYLLSLTATL